MKKFLGFLFLLASSGFIIYSFPQTRGLLPDFITGHSNNVRMAPDNSTNLFSLTIGGAMAILGLALTFQKVQGGAKDLKMKDKNLIMRDKELQMIDLEIQKKEHELEILRNNKKSKNK